MNKTFKISFVLVIIFGVIFFYFTKNFKIDRYLSSNYTPKYIINDLYKSSELNYRLLDKNEQKLYDEYITNLIAFKKNFSINFPNNYTSANLLFEKFEKINHAVIMDHPEIIYFGYPRMSTKDNKNLNIYIEYVIDSDDYFYALNYIKEEIDKIKESVQELNDYEKVKYVYEYLGNKNNYGKRNEAVGQSAYSAFKDELSPVCAGYSRASQIIFNNIGITSLLVSGKLKSNWFSGDSHEWNIVKVNGKYYNYDVTQSSITKGITNNITYYGFLNTKNKNTLSIDNKKDAPNLNGLKYDYYKYNKLEYNYKKNNLKELKDMITSKYTEVRIKNAESFKLNFDKIKDELNLKTYIVIDDVFILERN